MNKRGQITLFVILGIVILLLVTLAYNLISEKTETQLNTEIEIKGNSGIKEYVQNCLNSVLKEGIITIGYQGGYAYVPGEINGASYGEFNVPNLYDRGESNVLSSELVAEQIADYLVDNIAYCLDDFKYIRNMGYDVSYDIISSDVVINDRAVVAMIDFPVSVSKAGRIETLDELSSTVQVRLQYILDAVDQLVEAEIADPNWLDLTLLSSFDLELEYNVIDNDLIFVFTDMNSTINLEPYVFVFGNNFNPNRRPEVRSTSFILAAGEVLNYQIQAVDFDGDPMTYRVESDEQFTLSPEGVLFYRPSGRGNFFFKALVSDAYDTGTGIITVEVI